MNLLKNGSSKPRVIDLLRQEYGVSRPQAYRYVQEAVSRGKVVEIPEEKQLIVVKLPVSISQRVRRLKMKGEGSLSGIMAESLRAYLNRHG